ncbi:MAG: DUF3419 family protein [Sandaracinaceae bacterium]|jgi:S-adenosylmethionine-diacylglycerol 3-amino-3-carboxypropyl transferase|nr:DUF3419 family protein [Sandaracinaceae bacterium]MBP7681853.1 DUF3419 family protein [Deltaproteobacteria bacterium]MBK6808423.1 DUF3419 family protein [Sandaracinaceae bacterium]MBK7154424.1 DUF3419 family protein [Sandaracinaceae bacterium]MBK7777047.1 DUF3419 family protein [Sandaracinaceae bacterium]
MSPRNRLQFAVTREDPNVELEVLARFPRSRLLLIASGGCTALTLRAVMPDAHITLVDANPEQLAHVDRKLAALRDLRGADRLRAFNVGAPSDPAGLSECGNFESLFRGLRGFVHDFVLPGEAWLRFFGEGAFDVAELHAAFASAYWPVAFQLFFSDALLNTMFGPDATQHAVPGSYPGYFQELLERGLLRDDARNNPFLQHIFLGHYMDREACVPPFLQRPVAPSFERFHGFVEDVPNLHEHDFVNLSNILDWTAPAGVTRLCTLLADRLAPGAVVLWRQLNHARDIEACFGERFTFHPELGAQLQRRDRSLFYSSIHVGVRT